MAFGIKYSSDPQDIVNISWRQSESKTDVLIFEIGKMDDLIPKEEAERIRDKFVENKVGVKQISNLKWMDEYTDVEGYPDMHEQRFVSPEVFKVANEIVIFDDIVAIYKMSPVCTYLEIDDPAYANMMRDLFYNVWRIADVLVVGVGGSAHTKQYKPLSFTFSKGGKDIPVVAYPAKDDGVITKAFDRTKKGCIEDYVNKCLDSQYDKFKASDMVIAYVWNDGTSKMCDLWSMSRNKLSDDSGFLYDAYILREQNIVTDMGVSSGNSSIVVTAEELLMRDLVLEEGLDFQSASQRSKFMPKFPAGYVPEEEFYT
jgi:hypothetical protein